MIKMSKKFWLKNVSLENGFIDENERIVGTETDLFHLLIEDGRIAEISSAKPSGKDIEIVDAKGLLAIPSFEEKHIHLDKTHFGGHWRAATPFSGVEDRIAEEEKFLTSFLSYTAGRAEKLLQHITDLGVTHARVHCNVDPVVGLGNLKRVRTALDRYRDKLSYELVAFPQHGLLRSESVQFMKDAMRDGAQIVGGIDPATLDNDIERSLHQTMDMAVEFDADIDMHLHDTGSLGIYTIKRLCDVVDKAGWHGRVNISHGYALGSSPESEVIDTAEAMKHLGISLATTVPIDRPCPNIPLLAEKGVSVNLATDSINDHWSPFGSGDLLEKASRMAEKFGWIDEYSLTRALGLITNGSTPLDSDGDRQWPKVGDPANMVFLDCLCSAEAVARIPKRRAVMYKGYVVSGVL